MQMLETRTAVAILFVLALALFFLRKYTYNPLKKLLKKAAAGDTEAQYKLGLLYYQGKKTPQDPFQAFNWFDTAARGGHIRAQVAVAGLYNAGEGCEKNEEKGVRGRAFLPFDAPVCCV